VSIGSLSAVALLIEVCLVTAPAKADLFVVKVMLKFAANLSWLYHELPFLDRFEAAAKSGFTGVEFLFPYQFSPAEISSRLRATGLTAVLFNLPPGDFAKGERGIAALPGREKEFRDSVQQALEYANILAVPRLHVMAGIPEGVEPEKARATFLSNLEFALGQTPDLDLLIEPINNRDFPGYYLTTIEQAAAILETVKHSRLKIQLDWYHAQIMGGDLCRRTERFLGQVGHMQVAGVPDRSEPDRGEVNFAHLFRLVDQLGYQGWIGCEYQPAGKTEDGLAWLRPFRAMTDDK
jgi:hydroxypyruvate isomerase